MATTKPPPKHPSWNPQGFTAAAGAAALMLYVVGLIAVNDYLVSYGASDFSLLRARFVYTGALAMLAPALFLLVLSLLRSWLAISRGGELFAAGVRWKNGLAIACAAAVSWTVFAVALFLATPTSSRFADAARHGVTLLIGAALAVLFGWFTWQEWNAHRDRRVT